MVRSLIVFCAVLALATAAVAASAADNNQSAAAAMQLLPQLPQNRNLFCFNCYEMIDIVEQTWLLEEPKTKTKLDNWCDAAFGQLGDTAAQCKKWIDDDLDKIVDKLNNGWSAESICKSLHLCNILPIVLLNLFLSPPHFRPTPSSEEFLESKMKLVVLISVLLASLFASIDVHVTVRGTLTCPTPFHYRITLWEEDGSTHDLFGSLQTLYSNGTAKYEVSGMAQETWPSTWFEKEVESWITFEHSCGRLYACVCKFLGDRRSNFVETLDVNLEKPGLEYCEMCDEALERRGNE